MSDAEEREPIRIKDSRRIDPVTGQVRRTGGADTPPVEDAAEPDAVPQAAEPALDENALLLEERTKDLQRLQAEYANYRRRSDRDRLAAGEIATGRVMAELLPVLDDLDRARVHGDLTGPLKAVSEKLDSVLAKLGLVGFGEVGDEFDPAVHEAVLHDESDAVTVPTCTTIMRPGYKHGERLLRPALVGVSDPVAAAEPAADAPTEQPAQQD